MIRILVTGSRTWIDRSWIAEELTKAVTGRGGVIPYTPVTLVSGACPRGADRIAEEIATAWGWVVERHPADWDRHGQRAGILRNLEMVAAGADVCVAFVRAGSPGSTQCGRAAEKAGIPVRWNEAL